MGFGAIITHGDEFTVLERVMSWIVEARVEMELSKPTKFAVRFEDDICEGEFALSRDEALRADQMIGIFVRNRDQLHCLVHGPITRIRTAQTTGGTGSWIEVHGEDKRVVMNRVGIQATWQGYASDAAKAILGEYGFDYEVQQTRKSHPEPQGLSQRATDLAFLEDIARRNVMELWIDYPPVNDLGTGGIACNYKVNLKTSPFVQSFELLATPPVLTAAAGYNIDVHPPAGTCVRVTRFETRVDYERPNAATGFALAQETGETVENAAEPTLEPTTEDWTTLRQIDGVQRTAIEDPNPDPDDQYLAQQALLTDAAWFVEVDASSTLELIDFVVRPHMIVFVNNAGDRLTGAYQVKSATHVINAADHFIDFKLRANGLREAPQ
jgi:hypothetical protein